jgi:hypothetical protein
VSVLVSVWLVVAVAAFVALIALVRTGQSAKPEAAGPFLRRGSAAGLRLLFGALLMSALVAAVLASISGVPWPVAWAPLALAVGLAVFVVLRNGSAPEWPRPSGWITHVTVLATGAGLGVMALFINRSNTDDAFYVNRAVGTAELNRIPVRDIMFTHEALPPLTGTGLPVDSFSALQGAIGRLLGVHGASVAYYVTPSLFTFLAVWALWRLLRSWAPTNVFYCFVLGITYWVFSAQNPLTAGSYFVNRMWQGKVIFVAWMILTLYVLLTRWIRRRDVVTGGLLLAASVASIGMTGSASLVAPLAFASAGIALVVRRDWRGLPVIALAGAIPPLIGAGLTLFFFPHIDPTDIGATSKEEFSQTAWYVHEVFGDGPVGGITLFALCLAPALVRRGAAAWLTAGIASIVILLLMPLTLPLLNEVSDLSTLLRRMLWVVPSPAVVGLLAALPAALLGHGASRPNAALARVAAPILVVGAAALLVGFGRPVWFPPADGREALWVSRPSWKVEPEPMHTARLILRRYSGPGPVLVHAQVMHSMALLTAETKAVNPRKWYALFMDEPHKRIEYRLALTDFASGGRDSPSPQIVREGLDELEVEFVCLGRSRFKATQLLLESGFEKDSWVENRVCFIRA